MKITEKEVRYIAELANVSLSDDEVHAYQHDLEEILTYVKANPGERLEQIGVGMNTDTHDLKRPIFLMIADKKLKTTGQKRGTKYFPGRNA